MTPLSSDTTQRLMLAVIIVACALFYLSCPTKDDISWLLVVAESVLDGKRLYVDIIETNPPMSVLLYVPAVFLEHLLHLKAEAFVVFQTLAVCVLCTEIATRLIRKSGLDATPSAFRIAAVIVTLLLPMGAFGQKDHLAFAFSLPLLIVIAKTESRAFSLGDHLLAGLLGGLAMAIKPQFALAFALPGLVMAIRQRRLSVLHSPAIIVAAAFVLTYVLAVYLFFPSFVSQMLPMLEDLYLSRHMSRLLLLMPNRFGGYSLLVLMIAAWPLRHKALQPFPLVLILAGSGYFLAFMEQAKGWPYHIYPALASGLLLGLSVTIPELRKDTGSSRSAFLAYLGCIGVLFAWSMRIFIWSWIDYSPITKTILDLELERPRILSIAASHGTGHPVTRDVGGEWVGTLSSRWLTVSALTQQNLGFSSAHLNRSFADWMKLDRAYLRRDILEKRPDIILVQRSDIFDWLAWAMADPPVAAVFSQYSRIAAVADPEEPGTVEVWRHLPNDS